MLPEIKTSMAFDHNILNIIAKKRFSNRVVISERKRILLLEREACEA